MKINIPVKQITVTQKRLADAVGVTPARIHKLIGEGTVIRDTSDASGGVFLFESLKNYWIRVGAMASGGDDDEDIDYTTEKAKHERTKREIAEIQLAKLERRVYDAKTVELVMTEMLSTLRTQLLGLPSKLAPQLEGMKKEDIYTALTKSIEECLMELSEYTPDLFTEEVTGGADDEDSA